MNPCSFGISDAPASIAAAPSRQEITFSDGSAIWLHVHSRQGGQPFVYSREMPLGDGRFCCVDLVRAAPELQYALPTPSARETATVVFQCLRKRFDTAAQFRQAVGAPAP
jgi:hypothetical protein